MGFRYLGKVRSSIYIDTSSNSSSKSLISVNFTSISKNIFSISANKSISVNKSLISKKILSISSHQHWSRGVLDSIRFRHHLRSSDKHILWWHLNNGLSLQIHLHHLYDLCMPLNKLRPLYILSVFGRFIPLEHFLSISLSTVYYACLKYE